MSVIKVSVDIPSRIQGKMFMILKKKVIPIKELNEDVNMNVVYGKLEARKA